MPQQASSWPERYEVTFGSAPGGTRKYLICTWLSAEKAVAIATAHYVLAGGDPTDAVMAIGVGPARRLDSGLASPEDSDLIDRAEW